MLKIDSKTKYFWFFLILFLIIFIIIRANKTTPPLDDTVHNVSSPFAKFLSATGFWFSDKFGFIASIGSLKKENEKLLKENSRLKSSLAKLSDIENENENLRKELDLNPRIKEYEMEAALIIGKDIGGFPELVYIDKGYDDGIQKDDPVLVEKGILIGQIKEVFKHQSEVELILSQKKNFNAEIEENSEKGIVHGEYGTSVVMDMIPQTVEIKKGDTIITSGLSEKIPRGILIGYIEETTPSADQLFQKASLNLPVDLNKARVVWIIKK